MEGYFMNSTLQKRLLEKIKLGNGMQYILDEAYRILSNPIFIFDMEYKLIAASNSAAVAKDDPISNEFLTQSRLSKETIEFLKNEDFIDCVANCIQYSGVTFLISDNLKYDRIFGLLHNKEHLPVADLCVVACETPFENDALDLIKLLCNILSDELGNNDYYQDYGQKYQESIIKKLIDGSIEDKRIYSGQVANIDKGLKNNIFVAAVDIGHRDPSYTQLAHFRDLIKSVQPDFKYFIYTNRIVILLSFVHNELDVEKDLHALYMLFEQQDMYAGISNSFDNLYDLQIYYNKAVFALNHGLINKRRLTGYNSKESCTFLK